jgi:hypothetical protein
MPLNDGLAAGSRPASSRSRDSIPRGTSLNPFEFPYYYLYRGMVR